VVPLVQPSTHIVAAAAAAAAAGGGGGVGVAVAVIAAAAAVVLAARDVEGCMYHDCQSGCRVGGC